MGNGGKVRVEDMESGVWGVGREREALRLEECEGWSVVLEGRSVIGART